VTRTARGEIESPGSACLATREVSLLAKAGPRFERFSRDVSSDNGFFGGEGTQADGPPAKFKVVVRRKRLGPNRVCSGASDSGSTPWDPGRPAAATSAPSARPKSLPDLSLSRR
jgi:hypothetical protein